MVNVLSNGIDFLSIARGPYQNNGIGLSANSRRLTNDFLSNSSVLFNTLYLQTEDAELNLVKQILALRSKLGIEQDDAILRSQTRGMAVDTSA